ncbi:hypothetical protein [Halomarina litorea]|uniref:hypothetical protein n=1 Tax=Halomarina litorea TaxID=2961595 RepID=UPI0020C3C2C6|nr:hypothetical protein [Halomarina sp. BCD28]
MHSTRSTDVDPDEWPTYELDWTFNPRESTLPSVAPDELVVFDPNATSTRWVAAGRNSFVTIEDVR